MGIGVESRKDSLSRARNRFLVTITEFLSEEPHLRYILQADTLLDGFLWSKETRKMVAECAREVYKKIHGSAPQWKD